MAEEAILLVRRKTPVPPPPLPHDAGEHDDFLRDIAASDSHPRGSRHRWIGLVFVGIVAGAIAMTCVHMRSVHAPVQQGHVLPVSNADR